MEKALWDFAEAAMGNNRDMHWSLSESIMSRQVQPVFTRCAAGDLTADQALDVAVDFTTARMANVLEIFSELFHKLEQKMDVTMPSDAKTPARDRLDEFFLGLNTDVEWATDENIARRELYPLFVRVSVGNMDSSEAVIVFCDNVAAKRDFYFGLIRSLARELTQEVAESGDEIASPSDSEALNTDD